jgi:methylmalonyl-CoA mutase cobalamin-binding subunit
MKIADFVCVKAILPRLESVKRDEVIKDLVAALDKAGKLGKEAIEELKKNKAQVLALSTLMTPTLDSMVEVANLLKKEGLKSKIKLIIGGAAPDEKFAKEIGAQFFADVNSAIKLLDISFKR